MTLFLDACVLIYWMESVEPFYSELINNLQNLRCQYPEAKFAVSRLSWLECRVKPLRDKDQFLLELYQQFFATNDLKIIELDAQVVDIATGLRAKYNVRTSDALQVASALAISDSVLFITGDIKLKRIQDLDVLCL